MEKAAHYYKLAADQGDSDAQFNIGLSFLHGEGVEKDEKKSCQHIITNWQLTKVLEMPNSILEFALNMEQEKKMRKNQHINETINQTIKQRLCYWSGKNLWI